MQITLGNCSPFSKMGREDTLESDPASVAAPLPADHGESSLVGVSAAPLEDLRVSDQSAVRDLEWQRHSRLPSLDETPRRAEGSLWLDGVRLPHRHTVPGVVP